MAVTTHYRFSKREHPAAFLLTGLVLIAVAGYGVCRFRPVDRPDPATAPQEAVKFAVSNTFQKIGAADRRAYLVALRNTMRGNPRELFRNQELTDAERRVMMEHMRELFLAEQREKMHRFFNAGKEEQNRMLDEDIARMEKFRRAREAGRKAREAAGTGSRTTPGNPEQGRPTPPTAQERREREAAGNPVDRAQQQVYRQMMRQRREGRR